MSAPDRYVSLVFRRLFPLVRGLVPADVRGNSLLTWRVECMLASTLICIPTLTGYGFLYRHLGEPWCALLCWFAAGAVTLNAALLPAFGLRRARNVLIGAIFLLLLGLTWRLGGIDAPAVLWFTACPVVAATAGGRRSCVAWAVLAVGAVLAVLAAGHYGVFPQPVVTDMHLLRLISTVSFLVLLTLILLMFEQVSVSAIARLDEALARIHEQAGRDDLTGTFNRRKLVQEAERRIAAPARRWPLALCLLDIDHFKQINDRYGHGAGDEVLRAFAQAVQALVPYGDCFGRYGGEEFLILAEPAGEGGIHAYAERIRRHVAALRLPELEGERAVTVSIGVAVHAPGETFAQVVARADKALYAAKNGGRNRVELAPAGTRLPAMA